MQLIVRRPRQYHVSHDIVEELESAILRDMRVTPATMNRVVNAGISAAAGVIGRLGLDPGAVLRAGARGPVAAGRDYFAVMMHLAPAQLAPWFSRKARKSVYIFDAWPATHQAITRFVAGWGVQYAFVSSRQAAERLAPVSESCTFIWVPEGIDPARYERRTAGERDIDVLQIGRKFDAHHKLIAPALERAGKHYLFEKQKGTLVFPNREQLSEGLARSRISICVPSSITHPARAGDIETMTVRYLQSMASKCLVLGHAPAEMIDLFGYNPVIEIEIDNAADQVLGLLADYDSYLPMIERNYSIVTTEHTWDRRWERMSSLLFPQRSN